MIQVGPVAQVVEHFRLLQSHMFKTKNMTPYYTETSAFGESQLRNIQMALSEYRLPPNFTLHHLSSISNCNFGGVACKNINTINKTSHLMINYNMYELIKFHHTPHFFRPKSMKPFGCTATEDGTSMTLRKG